MPPQGPVVHDDQRTRSYREVLRYNPAALLPWEPPPAGGGGDADDGSSPPPSPTTPPLQQYVYDDLDRLAEVQAGDGSLQRRWTYDPTHNRLSEEVPGTSGGTADPGDQDQPTDPSGGTSGGVTPYTYANDSHRLLDVGGIARSYDAAGNTTQIDNQTLIYNAIGRLAEVREGALTIATYNYNGRGERVQKAAGGPTTIFVYNERGQLLGEYGAAGFVEYIWLDDLLVGVSTIDGLHRIETDHLGTPRIAKGQYGNTTWRWAIEDNAFGQKPAEVIGDGDSPGLELNLRFPGQYFDQETGLHYNYFRDYDPGVGRYVESDPIGLGGGINTYAYVDGNPINHIDFLGLTTCRGKWRQVGWNRAFNVLCSCVWLCISCEGHTAWSGNPNSPSLPRTRGTVIFDGSKRGGAYDPESGNDCICRNKPGPEESCDECEDGVGQGASSAGSPSRRSRRQP